MPDGSTSLLPKDDVIDLIISAFTSCELGFGFTVSVKILDEVNAKRRNPKCSDELAAQEITSSVYKGNFTKSPFLCELEYGKNINGYWTYNHILVQFEDFY